MASSTSSHELDSAHREKAIVDVNYDIEYVNDGNAVRSSAFTHGESVFAKLQRLAGKFGMEQRGIERVPNDERTDSSLIQVGTLVR